jgi:hypothetical protein
VAKKLWHLEKQEFTCEKDARQSVNPFMKGLKYHTISYKIEEIMGHQKKARPKKGDVAGVIGYRIVGTLVLDEGKVLLV